MGHAALPAVWTARDWRKACFPPLQAYYRHACRGSVRIGYPALLPLVSTLPEETVADVAGFWEPLLAALREGVAYEQFPTGDNAAPFVRAFAENVLYAATRTRCERGVIAIYAKRALTQDLSHHRGTLLGRRRRSERGVS